MKKYAALLLALALGPSLAVAECSVDHVVDRDGHALDLKSLRGEGQSTVFVFWQSWCGSCRKEAPELVETANQWKGKAQFVGVVSGPDEAIDEEKVDKFISDNGLSYPQVRDRELTLTRTFEVKGTPTIIVLNPQGEIVYRGHHAPERWSDILGS